MSELMVENDTWLFFVCFHWVTLCLSEKTPVFSSLSFCSVYSQHSFSIQHHLLSKFNEGISAYSLHKTTLLLTICWTQSLKLDFVLVLGRAVPKILEILSSGDQIKKKFQFSSVLCKCSFIELLFTRKSLTLICFLAKSYIRRSIPFCCQQAISVA